MSGSWHLYYRQMIMQVLRSGQAFLESRIPVRRGGRGYSAPVRLLPLQEIPEQNHGSSKQFIDVLGCGRTLIQLTADRFQGICPPENIWVVTSEKYADTVKEQLPDIADDHILREPCRRNTAPCIAYVSWKIKARNPKANMVVTPSDHIVMNIAEFQRVINSAMNFTADSDHRSS